MCVIKGHKKLAEKLKLLVFVNLLTCRLFSLQTLSVATAVLKQRQDNVQLVACSVLCIGEVCSAPVNDAFLLKQFSLTMPSVITLFKNTDFLLGSVGTLLLC